MSAFTTIRRELLNARVYFIPSGELVDSVTVTSSTWPDNNPTTNWTNYMLHDTETIKSERTYDTETFKIPKDAGAYKDDEENTLKKVLYTGTTAKTNSLFKKLEHALATIPVVGTAQAPHVDNNDYVEGVALLEFQNKTGVVTERLQIWARIRLTDPGDVGPATRKLTYTLERQDSGNNTYLLVA